MKMTGINASSLKEGLILTEFDVEKDFRIIELSKVTKTIGGIIYPKRNLVFSTDVGEVLALANLDLALRAYSRYGAVMVNPSQIINKNKLLFIKPTRGGYVGYLDDFTEVAITRDKIKGLEHLIRDAP